MLTDCDLKFCEKVIQNLYLHFLSVVHQTIKLDKPLRIKGFESY